MAEAGEIESLRNKIRVYEYMLALAIGMGDRPPDPNWVRELLENHRTWREHDPAAYLASAHRDLIERAEQDGAPDLGNLAL